MVDSPIRCVRLYQPVTPCLYSWGVGGVRLYYVFATFDIVRGQLQMDFMEEAAI